MKWNFGVLNKEIQNILMLDEFTVLKVGMFIRKINFTVK